MNRERMRRLFNHAFRMGVMAGFYHDEKPDVERALTATIPEMKRVTGGLLAELDRLDAAPELLAVLQQVEWVEDHKEKGLFYCPRCGGEMGMGHYDSCQLAAALARAEAPGSGERGKG